MHQLVVSHGFFVYLHLPLSYTYLYLAGGTFGTFGTFGTLGTLGTFGRSCSPAAAANPNPISASARSSLSVPGHPGHPGHPLVWLFACTGASASASASTASRPPSAWLRTACTIDAENCWIERSDGFCGISENSRRTAAVMTSALVSAEKGAALFMASQFTLL